MDPIDFKLFIYLFIYLFFCLITDILFNILFYIQQKKETHTSLEQHKNEKMMTIFSFFGELFLK